MVYIDDSYLQGSSYGSCSENVRATLTLLGNLGFTVNYVKSVLIPTQEIEFLGFLLNSRTMTMSLTKKRCDKIYQFCSTLLSKEDHSIREVSAALGCIIAALPAVKFGALFYRDLEACKNLHLKIHKLNYEALMTIS